MTAPGDTQETFISHLIELRSRLMRSIVAVVVVLLCLFPFAKQIYAVLAAPLLKALPAGSTMIATDVTGTFLVPLKLTLMVAFLVALPYVLYQMWAFVAPGLYQHEKRLAVQALQKAMAALSPESREILVLSRFQELKGAEIAGILDISVGAVKVRIHRAISQLKTLYLEQQTEIE